MCGIVGKVAFSSADVQPAAIKKMADAIAHRGPDDSGVFISPDAKVGLGHRRLAIIDLSPLGHQPMSYRDRYQIVFNGEIYNFQENRAMLEKDGYTFASHSDTEVILALYDKYKEKCLDHLRGMFAFAIYDGKEEELFCARDRVGKKPFKYYYDKDKGVFLFASELKAILTQPEYKKELDVTAVHHYLTYQYVPAPQTGFVGIQKLEPAHYLLINVKTGAMKKECYWHLDYSKKLHLSEAEWSTRIIDKLDESVRLRMIADVPLGAFLSGGIDSSAVVALMSRHSSQPVKTFSIGFNERKFTELEYAKIVADKFGTDHTEFIVEPNAIDILPMLVQQYEEPYADSSALATYYVSKLTREHVTVALNGDGGDENFGGYPWYSVQKFVLAYDRLRLLNQFVALPATNLLAKGIKNTFIDRSQRFAATAAQDYRYRYANYICYFTNEMKEKLYTDAMRTKMQDIDSYNIMVDAFNAAKTPDRLDQAFYADFTRYLPDDLLVKVDIATMAVALEGRSPFLDHEMLELSAQIPNSLKIRGRSDKKYILKQALRDILPHEVMYRRKMGFSIPIEQWFRHELRDYTRDHLLGSQAATRQFFDEAAIRHILDTHADTKINYSHLIWSLLTLELWLKHYFAPETG